MVTAVIRESTELTIAMQALEAVVDPEIPVLNIDEIGILRKVCIAGDGAVEVTITPTYSGCPAIDSIAQDTGAALEAAGIGNYRVVTRHSPAWTTDWMSADAHEKLRRYGIAPPSGARSAQTLFAVEFVECPRCGSKYTTCISEFGSTSCKAHYKCNACREPFDYFKIF